MQWSKAMQPPSYLRATRLAFLNEEFAEQTARYCGLFSGAYVLDVGCGTGCFSRYLSTALSNTRFVGVDNDADYFGSGLDMDGDNSIEYLECSAHKLPFEDNTFDAVVSHTFFNCVSDPETAMAEMKRVVKNSGTIASVTSMSLGYETWYTGNYPEGCEWRQQIDIFEREILAALAKMSLDPFTQSKGYPASYMPLFFSKSGLREICIFPLARAFSLSDAGMKKNDKLVYIENLYHGELSKLQALMESAEFVELFHTEKCRLYTEALGKRYNFWLANLDDNSIWDWFGSSSLLVSGIR